jgi:hypothetical protein
VEQEAPPPTTVVVVDNTSSTVVVIRGHEEVTSHKVPHAVEGDAAPSGGEVTAVGIERPR